MIIATFDTGNYAFTAVANHVDEADALLLKAWVKHSHQTGADSFLMVDAIHDGDVNYTEIEVGEVMRDDAILVARGE